MTCQKVETERDPCVGQGECFAQEFGATDFDIAKPIPGDTVATPSGIVSFYRLKIDQALQHDQIECRH